MLQIQLVLVYNTVISYSLTADQTDPQLVIYRYASTVMERGARNHHHANLAWPGPSTHSHIDKKCFGCDKNIFTIPHSFAEQDKIDKM